MSTDPDSQSSDRPREIWASNAMTLGTSVVVGVGLFTFIGYWLDKRRGGGVLFTLIGFGAGILYMVYEFWRVVSALNREQGGGKGGNVDDERSGKS